MLILIIIFLIRGDTIEVPNNYNLIVSYQLSKLENDYTNTVSKDNNPINKLNVNPMPHRTLMANNVSHFKLNLSLMLKICLCLDSQPLT